ncbi:MAG: hypothetical protein Q8O55_07485 [Dehalococcoidales bacterium]|nr:hypothetical protein [Dehalococcoidales bacterium]
MVKKYKLWQKVWVAVFGSVRLGLRQPAGFQAPTVFYLAKCKIHGYYEGYWEGDGPILSMPCPVCRKEAK